MASSVKALKPVTLTNCISMPTVLVAGPLLCSTQQSPTARLPTNSKKLQYISVICSDYAPCQCRPWRRGPNL